MARGTTALKTSSLASLNDANRLTPKHGLDIPPHVATIGGKNKSPTAMDFATIKADLKERMLCNKVIDSAVGRIRSDRLLLPDGKNFGQWLRDLCTIGRDHLNNPDFFSQPCTNCIYEKIGRAILLASVDSSLVLNVQDQSTSQNMVQALMKRFKLVSRTAQVNMWKQLLAFKLEDNYATIGAIHRLRDMILEWENMGVSLSEDIFLGFIVQNSIPVNSKLREEVDRHLEQYVQNHERTPIPLNHIIQTVETCRQQLILSGTDNNPPSITAHRTEASPPENCNFPKITYPVESFLADVPEEQWS